MSKNDSLSRRYAFFSINYFIQGVVGIAYEPLNYLLKDRLHLSPGGAAGFIAWMTFPLLLKPFYGFVTDAIPMGRLRRKPHLFLSALFASASFFAVSFEKGYTYANLLLPMALSCATMAFADAVCGGILVEDGKEREQTGRYQALHIGSLYLSAILVGAGSGWLTSHVPYRWIFAIAGGLPLAIVGAVFFIQEPDIKEPQKRVSLPVWDLLRSKAFWLLSLTIVLWNFYPFLGTVQFYYQSNVLHLNPQWIGSLMSVGSIMGFLGSAVFWKYCRGRNGDDWVSWGPAAMALVSLSYVFYLGPVSVTVVEAVYGFVSVFFRLALLDLIARTCPQDAEATSYALFLSFFDIAWYGSNAIGGKLYDFLQGSFAAHVHHDQLSALMLIAIGAGCTLACRWTLRFSQTTTNCSGIRLDTGTAQRL